MQILDPVKIIFKFVFDCVPKKIMHVHMKNIRCPHANDISAFLSGAIPPNEIASFTEHVELRRIPVDDEGTCVYVGMCRHCGKGYWLNV